VEPDAVEIEKTFFSPPSLPNKSKTSKAMCLRWLCVQVCSTRRHSVRDFRSYINQSVVAKIYVITFS
jgi:hypothetical protein